MQNEARDGLGLRSGLKADVELETNYARIIHPGIIVIEIDGAVRNHSISYVANEDGSVQFAFGIAIPELGAAQQQRLASEFDRAVEKKVY